MVLCVVCVCVCVLRVRVCLYLCEYVSGVSLQFKIFIGNKRGQLAVSAQQKVPLGSTGHIHEGRVSTCVCVCVYVCAVRSASS